MAGQFGVLALAAACVVSLQSSFGQNSGPPAGAQAWQEYIQQLPPEEKAKLEDNLHRWQALSPEEREVIRQRAQATRERMQQAAEAAMTQSGLTLPPDRKEAYVRQYLKERREIEEPLRKEMQQRRKPLVEEMTKNLDAEFAAASPNVDPGESEAKFQAWQQHSPPPGRQGMKKKILQEIDDAVRNSGLNLDDNRRQLYAWRYIQRRRKIEQQLHGELEAKRKPLVDALVERLRGEFGGSPSPTPPSL